MSEDTRTRLLEAAERILIEEGVHALTQRRVGKVSGLNSALVTYHFGTVAGLLAELCKLNLQPMIAEWEAIEVTRAQARTMREVLQAWLLPLNRPAAFTAGGRSLIVFDEIASHGDAGLRNKLLKEMLAVSERVQRAIRPFVPHLSPRELRARVRFISAAALGPPPRSRSTRSSEGEKALDGVSDLVCFAEAALMGPAADTRNGSRDSR